MKYGIRATFKDGTVKYVDSTRHRPSFTNEITSTALFVQEQSAIDAVKAIRKDGFEPPDVELDVVEINFVVVKSTKVRRPAARSGFVLMTTEGKYFHGTKALRKNPEDEFTDPNLFGNIERATFFKTVQAAKDRAAQLVVSAMAYSEYNTEYCKKHPIFAETLANTIIRMNNLTVQEINEK